MKKTYLISSYFLNTFGILYFFKGLITQVFGEGRLDIFGKIELLIILISIASLIMVNRFYKLNDESISDELLDENFKSKTIEASAVTKIFIYLNLSYSILIILLSSFFLLHHFFKFMPIYDYPVHSIFLKSLFTILFLFGLLKFWFYLELSKK